MAKGFNLTAEINLRGPSNIRSVVADIKRQVGTVSVNVTPTLNRASVRTIANDIRRQFGSLSAEINVRANAGSIRNLSRDIRQRLGTITTDVEVRADASSIRRSAANIRSQFRNISTTVSVTASASSIRQASSAIRRQLGNINANVSVNVSAASVRQAAANIRRQLGSINANINVGINAASLRGIGAYTTNLARLNAALAQTTITATNAAGAIATLTAAMGAAGRVNLGQINVNLGNAGNAARNAANNVQLAGNEIENFGRQAGLAIRRFAAFSVVTGVVFSVTNAFKNGVSAFIEYDQQLTRISQVTGDAKDSLGKINSTISELSTSLGVSSKELATTSVTLAQAGLTARDTETALKALALSALAPSFDDMNQTVEGSIALMRQFGISSKELEGSLGSINAVAAKFAVEASDIITAIQRTGGVFAAAGKGVSEGTNALNEFVAVFTSIRATTRESAETIATGLRTIFTRIQRADTIEALKEFGVTLTDLEGKFVGPYIAVQRLSEGLSKLDPRDLSFSRIVEELGGFRQIGKVLPLIQQFATAQDALRVAQQGQGSLSADAAKGQMALAIQISKVREEFLALIRSVGNTDSFQNMVKVGLDLASALIKVADAAKGLIPLIGLFAAFRGAQAVTQFAGGFGRGFRGAPTQRSHEGGPIRHFATGGYVPGSGDTDTVPARLTAGEFVIRKKAVQSIGLNKLNALNRNGGGAIQKFRSGGKAYSVNLTDKDTQASHVSDRIELSNIDRKRYANLPVGRGKRSSKFNAEAVVGASNDFHARTPYLLSLPRIVNQAAKRGGVKIGDAFYEGVDAGSLKAWIKMNPGLLLKGRRAILPKNLASNNTTDFANQFANAIAGSVVHDSDLAIAFSRVKHLLSSQYIDQREKQLDLFASTGKRQVRHEGFRKASLMSQAKNFGGSIRRFAIGGGAKPVTRTVGVIDSDSWKGDPVVAEQMKIMNIAKLDEYKVHMSNLVAAKRKSGDIRRLRTVFGVAASGKTTAAYGGARSQEVDNARLRKTIRRTIRVPSDLERLDEVIDTTSVLGPRNAASLRASDRIRNLSSRSKASQDAILARRDDRDRRSESGVPDPSGRNYGLWDRRAGATKSAPFNSGEDEAWLAASEVSGVDRKKVITTDVATGKRIGAPTVRTPEKTAVFQGALRPTTAGHVEAIMQGAKKSKVSPEDTVIYVAGNTPIDPFTRDDQKERTAILPQTSSSGPSAVGMAQAVLGSKGFNVSAAPKGTAPGALPKAFKIAGKEDSYIVPKSTGNIAYMGDDKPATTMDRYRGQGYEPIQIARDGISGTAARAAIMSNDVEAMKKLLTPEGIAYLKPHMATLQKRPQLLDRIFERFKKNAQKGRGREGRYSSTLTELSTLPARVTAKTPADVAARVKDLRELRDRDEAILGRRVGRMLPKLEGLGRSSGGHIQNFMAGGVAQAEKAESRVLSSSPTPMLQAILARVKKNPQAKDYQFSEYRKKITDRLNQAYKGILMSGSKPSKEDITKDTVISMYDDYVTRGYVDTTVGTLEKDLGYIKRGGETGKQSLKKRKGIDVGDMLDTIRGYQALGLDYVINTALTEGRTDKTIAEFMGEDLPKSYKTTGRGDIKISSLVNKLEAAAQYKMPGTLYSGLGKSKLDSILGQIKIQPTDNINKLKNKTFTLPSFVSASDEKSVANTFARVGQMIISTNPKKKGIIPDNAKSTTVDRESVSNRKKKTKLINSEYGDRGIGGMYINESYADSYDSEGEYIFPPNSKFKVLSASGRLPSKKDIGNVDMKVQQLASGGKIQRFMAGGAAEDLESMGGAALKTLAGKRQIEIPRGLNLDSRAKLSTVQETQKRAFLEALKQAGILAATKAAKTSAVAQSRSVAVVGLTGERVSEEVTTPGATDKATGASVRGVPVTLQTGALPPALARRVQALIRNRVERIVADVGSQISQAAGMGKGKRSRADIRRITSKDLEDITGSIFEKGLGAANLQYDEKAKAMDFPQGLNSQIAKLVGVDPGVMTDATNVASKENAKRKIKEGVADRARLEARARYGRSQFAAGGDVENTVPALLTPGEAVLTPEEASNFSKTELDRFNHAEKYIKRNFGGGISIVPGTGDTDSFGPVPLRVGSYVLRKKATEALGLSGFNRGGSVGSKSVQEFAVGGAVQRLFVGGLLNPPPAARPNLGGMNDAEAQRVVGVVNTVNQQLGQLATVLQDLGVTSGDTARLMQRGTQATYAQAIQATEADIRRARVAGASAQQIAAAESMLRDIRQQADRDIRARRATVNTPGGARASLGSLGGQDLQRIDFRADRLRQQMMETERNRLQSQTVTRGGRTVARYSDEQVEERVQRRAGRFNRQAYEQATTQVTGGRVNLGAVGLTGDDAQRHIQQSMRDRNTLAQMDRAYIPRRAAQIRQQLEAERGVGATARERAALARQALRMAEQEARDRANTARAAARAAGAAGPGGGAEGGIARSMGMAFGLQMVGSLLAQQINPETSSSNAQLSAGLQGGTNMLATGTMISSGIMEMFPSMTRLLGPIALLTTASLAAGQALIDARNAAIEFEKKLADKRVQDAMERVGQGFDKLSKNIKDIKIQDDITNNLIEASRNVRKSVEADKTTAKAFWANIGDVFRSTASSGIGSQEAAASRSKILEKQGVSAYLGTTSIGQYLSGAGGDSDKRAEARRSTLVKGMIPETAREDSKKYVEVAQGMQRIIEDKLRSGLSVRELLTAPKHEFEQIARTMAMADQATHAQILAVQADTSATAAQKEEKIKNIATLYAEDKIRKSAKSIDTEKASKNFDKNINNMSRSLERMFQNMDQAIERTSFSLRQMSQDMDLLSASLGGQAKTGDTSLKSMNVLQNPRAYGGLETNAARDQASSFFTGERNLVKGLLSIGDNLETSVMSSINKTLTDNPAASNEQIGINIEKQVTKQIAKLQLPPDVGNKLGEQVKTALDEMRKRGDENVNFDDLMEKIPALGKVLESGKRAQESALKALEHWQSSLNSYSEKINQLIDVQIDTNERLRRSSDLVIYGNMEVARALGKDVSVSSVRSARNVGVAQRTGGLTDADSISKNIMALESRRQSLESSANSAGNRGLAGANDFVKFKNGLLDTSVALRENIAALKTLAENGDIASAALGKIQDAQQKQAGKVGFFEKLVTSTPEEVNSLERAMTRLQNNINGQLNTINNSVGAQKAYNDAIEQGATNAEAMSAAQVAFAGERKETLSALNDLLPFLSNNQQGNNIKANVLESMARESGVGINPMMQEVLNSLRNPQSDPETQAAMQQYQQAINEQVKANTLLAKLNETLANDIATKSAQALREALTGAVIKFENSQLADIANNVRSISLRGGDQPVPPAAGKANGGMIYAAAGTMVNFQPKGTDTVPAMLTPGEFVVNRSATSRNLPLLQSINSGGYSKGGSVNYYSSGGYVSSVFKSEYLDSKNLENSEKKYIDPEDKTIKDIISGDDKPAKVAGGWKQFTRLQSPSAKYHSAQYKKSFLQRYLGFGQDERNDPIPFDTNGKLVPGVAPTIVADPIEGEYKYQNIPPFDIDDPMKGGGLGYLLSDRKFNSKNIAKNDLSKYRDIINRLINVVPPANIWGMNSSAFDIGSVDNLTGGSAGLPYNPNLTSSKPVGLIMSRGDSKFGKLPIEGTEGIQKIFTSNRVFTGQTGNTAIKDRVYGAIQGTVSAGSLPDPMLDISGNRHIGNILDNDRLKWITDQKEISGLKDIQKENVKLIKDTTTDVLGGRISWLKNTEKNTKLISLQQKLQKIYEGGSLIENIDVAERELIDHTQLRLDDASGKFSLLSRQLEPQLAKRVAELSTRPKDQQLPQDRENARVATLTRIGGAAGWADGDAFPINYSENGLIKPTALFPWIANIDPEFFLQNIKEQQDKQAQDRASGKDYGFNISSLGLQPYTAKLPAPLDQVSFDYKADYTKYSGRLFNLRQKELDNTRPLNDAFIINPKHDDPLNIFKNANFPDKSFFTGFPGVYQPQDLAKRVIVRNPQSILDYMQALRNNDPNADALAANINGVSLALGPSLLRVMNDKPLYLPDDLYYGIDNSFQNVDISPFVVASAKNAATQLKGLAGEKSSKINTPGSKTQFISDADLAPTVQKIGRASLSIFGRKPGVPSGYLYREFGRELYNITNPIKAKNVATGIGKVFSNLVKQINETTPRNSREFAALRDSNILATGAANVFNKLASGSTNYVKQFLGGGGSSIENLFRSLGSSSFFNEMGGTQLGEDFTRQLGVDLKGSKLAKVGADGSISLTEMNEQDVPKGYQGLVDLAINPYHEFSDRSVRQGIFQKLMTDIPNFRANHNVTDPKTGTILEKRQTQLPLFGPAALKMIMTNLNSLSQWYGGNGRWSGQDYLNENDPATTPNERAEFLASNFDGALYTQATEAHRQLGGLANFGDIPNREWLMARGQAKMPEPKPVKQQNLATGGIVYASNGQYVNYQPRGTDTVPAMLTPGEFVVNRSATQQNLPLLRAINSGANAYSSGGVVYAEKGGGIWGWLTKNRSIFGRKPTSKPSPMMGKLSEWYAANFPEEASAVTTRASTPAKPSMLSRMGSSARSFGSQARAFSSRGYAFGRSALSNTGNFLRGNIPLNQMSSFAPLVGARNSLAQSVSALNSGLTDNIDDILARQNDVRAYNAVYRNRFGLPRRAVTRAVPRLRNLGASAGINMLLQYMGASEDTSNLVNLGLSVADPVLRRGQNIAPGAGAASRFRIGSGLRGAGAFNTGFDILRTGAELAYDPKAFVENKEREASHGTIGPGFGGPAGFIVDSGAGALQGFTRPIDTIASAPFNIATAMESAANANRSWENYRQRQNRSTRGRSYLDSATGRTIDSGQDRVRKIEREADRPELAGFRDAERMHIERMARYEKEKEELIKRQQSDQPDDNVPGKTKLEVLQSRMDDEVRNVGARTSSSLFGSRDVANEGYTAGQQGREARRKGIEEEKAYLYRKDKVETKYDRQDRQAAARKNQAEQAKVKAEEQRARDVEMVQAGVQYASTTAQSVFNQGVALFNQYNQSRQKAINADRSKRTVKASQYLDKPALPDLLDKSKKLKENRQIAIDDLSSLDSVYQQDLARAEADKDADKVKRIKEDYQKARPRYLDDVAKADDAIISLNRDAELKTNPQDREIAWKQHGENQAKQAKDQMLAQARAGVRMASQETKRQAASQMAVAQILRINKPTMAESPDAFIKWTDQARKTLFKKFRLTGNTEKDIAILGATGLGPELAKTIIRPLSKEQGAILMEMMASQTKSVTQTGADGTKTSTLLPAYSKKQLALLQMGDAQIEQLTRASSGMGGSATAQMTLDERNKLLKKQRGLAVKTQKQLSRIEKQIEAAEKLGPEGRIRRQFAIQQQLLKQGLVSASQDGPANQNRLEQLGMDKNRVGFIFQPQVAQQQAMPNRMSTGGVVYAADGTLIPYSPRGTDTVPAMLTPGEFVVNAKATSQHLPLLQSINKSNGGVIYRAEGGETSAFSKTSAPSSAQSSAAIRNTELNTRLQQQIANNTKDTASTVPKIAQTTRDTANDQIPKLSNKTSAFQDSNSRSLGNLQAISANVSKKTEKLPEFDKTANEKLDELLRRTAGLPKFMTDSTTLSTILPLIQNQLGAVMLLMANGGGVPPAAGAGRVVQLPIPLIPPQQGPAGAPPLPPGFNKGGVVYASNGTLVSYQPKGSDTVPAMLTPGEFVVNAQATRANLPLLQSINRSKGGTIYANVADTEYKAKGNKAGKVSFEDIALKPELDPTGLSAGSPPSYTKDSLDKRIKSAKTQAGLNKTARKAATKDQLGRPIENPWVKTYEKAFPSINYDAGGPKADVSATDIQEPNQPNVSGKIFYKSGKILLDDKLGDYGTLMHELRHRVYTAGKPIVSEDALGIDPNQAAISFNSSYIDLQGKLGDNSPMTAATAKYLLDPKEIDVRLGGMAQLLHHINDSRPADEKFADAGEAYDYFMKNKDKLGIDLGKTIGAESIDFDFYNKLDSSYVRMFKMRLAELYSTGGVVYADGGRLMGKTSLPDDSYGSFKDVFLNKNDIGGDRKPSLSMQMEKYYDTQEYGSEKVDVLKDQDKTIDDFTARLSPYSTDPDELVRLMNSMRGTNVEVNGKDLGSWDAATGAGGQQYKQRIVNSELARHEYGHTLQIKSGSYYSDPGQYPDSVNSFITAATQDKKYQQNSGYSQHALFNDKPAEVLPVLVQFMSTPQFDEWGGRMALQDTMRALHLNNGGVVYAQEGLDPSRPKLPTPSVQSGSFKEGVHDKNSVIRDSEYSRSLKRMGIPHISQSGGSKTYLDQNGREISANEFKLLPETSFNHPEYAAMRSRAAFTAGAGKSIVPNVWGMSGAALGTLGGPAAPITVPLGYGLGAIGGAIAQEIGLDYLFPEPNARANQVMEENPGSAIVGSAMGDAVAGGLLSGILPAIPRATSVGDSLVGPGGLTAKQIKHAEKSLNRPISEAITPFIGMKGFGGRYVDGPIGIDDLVYKARRNLAESIHYSGADPKTFDSLTTRFTDPVGGAFGDYMGGLSRISPKIAPEQMIGTIAHEAGHHYQTMKDPTGKLLKAWMSNNRDQVSDSVLKRTTSQYHEMRTPRNGMAYGRNDILYGDYYKKGHIERMRQELGEDGFMSLVDDSLSNMGVVIEKERINSALKFEADNYTRGRTGGSYGEAGLAFGKEDPSLIRPDIMAEVGLRGPKTLTGHDRVLDAITRLSKDRGLAGANYLDNAENFGRQEFLTSNFQDLGNADKETRRLSQSLVKFMETKGGEGIKMTPPPLPPAPPKLNYKSRGGVVYASRGGEMFNPNLDEEDATTIENWNMTPLQIMINKLMEVTKVADLFPDIDFQLETENQGVEAYFKYLQEMYDLINKTNNANDQRPFGEGPIPQKKHEAGFGWGMGMMGIPKAKDNTLYASTGTLVNYQPRGTDTVPAMLTPGEFVVNRASTQEHLPLLKAINSGYYQRGGVAGGKKGANIVAQPQNGLDIIFGALAQGIANLGQNIVNLIHSNIDLSNVLHNAANNPNRGVAAPQQVAVNPDLERVETFFKMRQMNRDFTAQENSAKRRNNNLPQNNQPVQGGGGGGGVGLAQAAIPMPVVMNNNIGIGSDVSQESAGNPDLDRVYTYFKMRQMNRDFVAGENAAKRRNNNPEFPGNAAPQPMQNNLPMAPVPAAPQPIQNNDIFTSLNNNVNQFGNALNLATAAIQQYNQQLAGGVTQNSVSNNGNPGNANFDGISQFTVTFQSFIDQLKNINPVINMTGNHTVVVEFGSGAGVFAGMEEKVRQFVVAQINQSMGQLSRGTEGAIPTYQV